MRSRHSDQSWGSVANLAEKTGFVLLLLIAACLCLAACGRRSANNVVRNHSQTATPNSPVETSASHDMTERDMVSHVTAGDYLLQLEDHKKFQSGRSKPEILNDVQWRGDLEMATTYDGKSVYVISFGIFGGPFSKDHRGAVIWGLFVNDKFEKFVTWQAMGDERIEVGDFRRLVRALEAAPLKLSEIEKEPVPTTRPPRSIDPGLTVVYLALQKGLRDQHERDLQKNLKLRQQFNGLSLSLGMTEAEVTAIFQTQPLIEGKVEAGSFKVYGGTESLDVTEFLHYSNILVLFAEGKVIGIYSGQMAPGGKIWRDKLNEMFLNLPLTSPKDGVSK